MLKVLDFKVDVKYFLKSWRTLNYIQPSKKSMFTQQLYTRDKTHCLLRLSTNPNGKIQPKKPPPFWREEERQGWD